MGVSVHVKGVREADGKLAKMVELVLLCRENDVSYPAEVEEYFADSDAIYMATRGEMKRAAMEVRLDSSWFEGAVESGEGMRIDLTKVPADVVELRVYMS